MSDDTKSLAARYKIPSPAQLDAKDTIMVVEDQTDLRLIVTHQLKKLNFANIRHATNGYEAIESLRETPGKIAAFIVDQDMPILGGLELLAELRESTALERGPFCLTMDHVSKEKLMLAVENGVDEILVKPFTLADVGPKLRSAFAKFHNPGNPEKLYELAKRELREGKLEQSEKIYAELATAAKKSARPVVGLARIAVKRGDLPGALKHLAEAEARNKSYVHLFSERAEIYAAKGEWDLAIDTFKHAIALSPLNPLRYKAAAELLFKVKRFQDAADLLELAVNHKLEFPELFHFLSQAKFSVRDYKAAARYVRQALAGDPENVIYLNQLGVCLKETDQIEDAMKAYNQAIKIDPTNGSALYNKGVLLHARGELEEAIKHLERAVAKNPEFGEAKAKLEEYKREEAQKPKTPAPPAGTSGAA
jgi:tetratricopeptide (TPR) repeat protein